ncbi:MAG: glycogen/starch synthase [Marinagarivorans sp.]|nr:glycogen/starch synthase [Marinagarivorans sp.]
MTKRILMLASENDALPNAKVGGIGDVVRDIPLALAEFGCDVQVILPDYGYFAVMPSAELCGEYSVSFAGGLERVELYRILSSTQQHESVSYWALRHRRFSPCGDGRVYCNDENNRPFATDASKYAFFCAAVAQAIIGNAFGKLDALHLHDWHAALLLVLREFDPKLAELKKLRTVYTIHNLSLQGVRPFKGDESSFETWFPYLKYSPNLICDTRAVHCINPMRAGINLSDKVHAVSPTYAQEITRKSNVAQGIYGGEGLDHDLIMAREQGRLVGILNGCEYPADASYIKVPKVRLIPKLIDALLVWASKTTTLDSCHWLAEKRLTRWAAKKDRGMLVTSVGRITDQKVRILFFVMADGKTVVQKLLEALGDKGVFIFLGSGTEQYQKQLLALAGTHTNFIYLQGYSTEVSDLLYNSGDLFLMPSSFEPCGISQMLAMRAGQPCLVHKVGGLSDTVIDGVTGFVFAGADLQSQSQGLLDAFERALTTYKKQPTKYAAMIKKASAERFLWSSVAKEYLEKLY